MLTWRLRLDYLRLQPRRLLQAWLPKPNRAMHRPHWAKARLHRAKAASPRGRPLRARRARGRTRCCLPPQGRSKRSANWRTRLTRRPSRLPRRCHASNPRHALQRRGRRRRRLPTFRRRPLHPFCLANRPPLAISNPPPPPPTEVDPSEQGQGTGGHWPDHHPFQTALQQAEAARLGMSYDSYRRRHSAAEIFELIRALDRQEAQPGRHEAPGQGR